MCSIEPLILRYWNRNGENRGINFVGLLPDFVVRSNVNLKKETTDITIKEVDAME